MLTRNRWVLTSLLMASIALADEAETPDALWLKRDEPGATQKIAAHLQASLEGQAEDFETLWRMSRLRFWMAETTPDAAQRAKYLKEGVDFGEKAGRKNPQSVKGFYWAAVNLGSYAEVSGILRALQEGLEPRLVKLLDTAITLDANFDGGAPHVVKGRYYSLLPWPKRDLDRSRDELLLALKVNPANPRALVFLAETYLMAGEDEKAQALLARLLEARPVHDPPDDKRMLARARELAKRQH
jgi:tetratricopeptide (TPR) repeat protein